MNLELKTFKFRIYPTPEQINILNKNFGCARFIWNKLVENFNAYGTDQYNARLNEKVLKNNPDFSFLIEANAAVLQQQRIDYTATLKQYFNKNRKIKLGRPKFKKKQGRQSIRLPSQKFKLDQTEGKIRFEKLGSIKIILDRVIPDGTEYRSATISRTTTGKYFVSILAKLHIDFLPSTGKIVGIDLGLNDLMTLSTGHKISNPRWFANNQSKLRKVQKCLSRKKKGSNRYKRQRIKVARVHEKITNSRKHFTHTITTSLVKSFDVITMEDLNVAAMRRGLRLGKSVSDANLSEFVRQLDYKSKWYGKSFVKIDRFYPSTKMCSTCGCVGEKKTLDVREWTCNECNTHHDRDLNAAYNILAKGFADLCGETQISDISAELVDYRRGEDVNLYENLLDLSIVASVKRLDKSIDLS